VISKHHHRCDIIEEQERRDRSVRFSNNIVGTFRRGGAKGADLVHKLGREMKLRRPRNSRADESGSSERKNNQPAKNVFCTREADTRGVKARSNRENLVNDQREKSYGRQGRTMDDIRPMDRDVGRGDGKTRHREEVSE
jgi:hypothetical protein